MMTGTTWIDAVHAAHAAATAKRFTYGVFVSDEHGGYVVAPWNVSVPLRHNIMGEHLTYVAHPDTLYAADHAAATD